MSSTTVYDMVNERILAALESGTVPWRRPWAVKGGPRNLVSGKPYRGINTFLLGLAPYASPYWLTFKQATDLGGSVRKGEKSSVAVFWKIDVKRDEETGEVKRVPILRYFRVFNLEQCDGVRIPRGRELSADAGDVIGDADRIAAADAVVSGYDGPSVTHGGDRAYYSPMTDAVVVPDLGQFESVHAYYCTLFHELGHSTGHASRLDRFGDKWQDHAFGSAAYGREELVAEMTAAYLCGETGISPDTLEQSAAYIDSWRRAIKEDVRAVVVAAGAAQRATDMILGRTADATGDADAKSEPVPVLAAAA